MSVHIPCAAVLFDSDGVLVDSDASVERSWRRWAREYGVDRPDLLAMVHGRRSQDTVATLLPENTVAAGLEAVDRYEVEDAAIVTAIPGAVALMASVPGERKAVVTSARRELVLARLTAAGITLPGVVIGAEDVARGKPAPDGYLAAAERLGRPPAETVVVEDSPSGIAAARSAGVGAVVGVGPRALATDADVVVVDLTALTWDGAGLLVDVTRALRV